MQFRVKIPARRTAHKLKVSDGAPYIPRRARPQIIQDRHQQPEVALAGLAGRQQLLRNLGQIIQCYRRAVASSQQPKLRTDELTGIQIHQLPRLPLEV